MILFGASGHAKVIIDILESCDESVNYLVDADPSIQSLKGLKVILDTDFENENDDPLIISIGNNAIRKKVATQLTSRFGKAIHAKAILSKSVTIEEGTVVMAGAVINSDVRVGRHCIVNTSASIDHDCELADYVHVSPNATLCGNVRVGEGTQIGAGATVIPNLSIGKWATIGAGAVIVRDVPDYAVVVGNPGKILKYNEQG